MKRFNLSVISPLCVQNIQKTYKWSVYRFLIMELDLKKFRMQDITFEPDDTKGPVIVFIGKRDTGKSFLVRDLLYYFRHLPTGIVMSGSEEGNGFYGKLVPKVFIRSEYNNSHIEQIILRQRDVLKKIKEEKQRFGRVKSDPRIFVILDDCLYDSKWTKDKLMRMLFMNGRHWKVMLIITMQYPLGIGPQLRTNIDYTFILRENYIRNRKIIYECYAGMFPTFESFSQIMNQCTENYECLVIHNNAKSNKLVDQVYWYKADDHPDFRMGAKKYWDISEQIKDDVEDGKDQYDPNKIKKRSSEPIISVKKHS